MLDIPKNPPRSKEKKRWNIGGEIIFVGEHNETIFGFFWRKKSQIFLWARRIMSMHQTNSVILYTNARTLFICHLPKKVYHYRPNKQTHTNFRLASDWLEMPIWQIRKWGKTSGAKQSHEMCMAICSGEYLLNLSIGSVFFSQVMSYHRCTLILFEIAFVFIQRIRIPLDKWFGLCVGIRYFVSVREEQNRGTEWRYFVCNRGNVHKRNNMVNMRIEMNNLSKQWMFLSASIYSRQ